MGKIFFEPKTKFVELQNYELELKTLIIILASSWRHKTNRFRCNLLRKQKLPFKKLLPSKMTADVKPLQTMKEIYHAREN